MKILCSPFISCLLSFPIQLYSFPDSSYCLSVRTILLCFLIEYTGSLRSLSKSLMMVVYSTESLGWRRRGLLKNHQRFLVNTRSNKQTSQITKGNSDKLYYICMSYPEHDSLCLLSLLVTNFFEPYDNSVINLPSYAFKIWVIYSGVLSFHLKTSFTLLC